MKRTEVSVSRSRNLVRIAFFGLTLFLLFVMFASTAAAQLEDKQSGTAVCTLDNGKQVSARYIPVRATRDSLPQDKVWAPGGAAITLFTETGLTIGNKPIAVGAYTMYLMPGKKDWTLIVSKNMDIDHAYNQELDLARAPMSTGKLNNTVPELRVTFGHVAPTTCELNVDFGTTKAWVEFTAL